MDEELDRQELGTAVPTLITKALKNAKGLHDLPDLPKPKVPEWDEGMGNIADAIRHSNAAEEARLKREGKKG